MTDTISAHDHAWEEALEDAINRFEQGESVSEAEFAELVQELEKRHADAQALPQDDPYYARMASLKERASRLEASAAEGTGPTDQVSSVLAPLVGLGDKDKPAND